MKHIMQILASVLGFAVLIGLAACSALPTTPMAEPVSTLPSSTPVKDPNAAPTSLNMPNPASVFCVEQGYKSEIRTTSDGSQTGYCIFPDGSECDEWAYFRGECQPTGLQPTTVVPEIDSDGWKIYRNEVLGYSFHYPPNAEVTIADEPLKSLIISGPDLGDASWGISHPDDREEYRPPEGVDLFQWLTDHYMVGPQRMPDTQIAGSVAIHFRQDRSPQSPAVDRYYFARAGQLYMVLIGHANSDVEDWSLPNRFLQSIQFDGITANDPVPTAIPTPLPFSSSDYQGWWTYTHPVYNFSIMLPTDWVVDETTRPDPLMNGHLLTLHPTDNDKESIRMTVRRAGEDVPLWPTGVGSGEFIPQGTLEISGQPARRLLFVCPTGEISSIWYDGVGEGQPNILRGELEFAFIYSYTYCEPGFSLGGKIQRIGEMIIASLKVP